MGEEKTATLKELLLARANTDGSIFSLLGGVERSVDQPSEEEVDAKIASLLGEEEREIYTHYEKIKTSRKAANKYQSVLASRDLAMNAEQRQQMQRKEVNASAIQPGGSEGNGRATSISISLGN